MKRILITGAGSFIGEGVKKYILATAPQEFKIDTIDTMNGNWKKANFSQYDVVFHVAGIAHVNAKAKMMPLYYQVNRDLTVEVAEHAKKAGVRQFVFMSSQIVYRESKNLKGEILTKNTQPHPNGFYGDSKYQAEKGLHQLESDTFKICILRPPMIYGPHSKGNFPKLIKLAIKVPLFPLWHNKRSMLYIDNFAEFVKQAILRELNGTFYPQNRELSDTVEIIRFFAENSGHHIWFTRLFNPCVWLASFVLQPINKMFATYYYDPEMSKMDFDYQLVSLHESLKRVAKSMKSSN